MNERAYYGHESQLFGVEEYRLAGGKGDGMRLLQVKNGLGLEFTVSADRCADIARLSLHGQNCGFFSVNGYVDPAYYDDKQAGWLKNLQRLSDHVRSAGCRLAMYRRGTGAAAARRN